MTQEEFAAIRHRFHNGQCRPEDMKALLDTMVEAPPEGYSTWRMYRLTRQGIVRKISRERVVIRDFPQPQIIVSPGEPSPRPGEAFC